MRIDYEVKDEDSEPLLRCSWANCFTGLEKHPKEVRLGPRRQELMTYQLFLTTPEHTFKSCPLTSVTDIGQVWSQNRCWALTL